MPIRALEGCLAWVGGTSLALAAGEAAPRLALGLAAAGVAQRGRSGRLLTLLGASLLRVWLLPLDVPDAVGLARSSRPVTLLGTLQEGWTRGRFGWDARLRTRWLVRGRRVERWRATVRISLAGDEPPPPRYGAMRATGFLGRPPEALNLATPQRGPWRLRIKSPVFVSGEVGRWSSLAGRLEAVRERPAVSAGSGTRWARALLFGDREALESREVTGFRAQGLAHLLAVSGLHLGIVVAPLALAARLLPRAARFAPPLAMAGLYVALAGARHSLLRAAAMLAAAGVGWAAGRPAAALQSLARVAALLVAVDPPVLHDVGFRLTVSATAGVLLSDRLFPARCRALPPALGRALAASLGAQLLSLPWSVPAFHLVTPLAPIWNLLAVPWAGASLWTALLWVASARLAPGGAAERWCRSLLDRLAAPLGALPLLPASAVPVRAGPLGALLLAAALTALAARPSILRGRGAALLLAPALLVWWAWPRPEDPASEVVVLDVGQGDAILLRTGAAAVLVDGGGWREGDFGGRILLPALLELGVRRLEAVVSSHPDLDHCGGLRDIAAYLPVEEVWIAPGWRAPCAMSLLLLPRVRLRVLWAGERLRRAGWSFEAIHPAPGARGSGNSRSLVLRADRQGTRVLLTGDVDRAAEWEMARRSPGALAAAVLKVAHHGSRTSSGPAFLRAVSPRLAVVSAGWRNAYGHPSASVLVRFRALGIPLLRTDLTGRLRLRVEAGGRFRLELPARGR